MKKFKIEQSNGTQICRLCYETIEKDQKMVSLRNIYICGKTTSMFFHTKCFIDSVYDVHIELSMRGC